MPQPDLALPRGLNPYLEAIPPQWREPLLRLVLACSGLVFLFGGDWAAMGDQWWNSSTYNHVLFVLPICGWLVALRLQDLARLSPVAWWPGLLLVGSALFLWLLGAVSETNTARQLGVVLALQGTALALLGPRVAVGLAFPLCYLLFLVPFGDELVPQMQMITARITIALVEASGIPAHIDGVFIDTPAGLFEVAEACSGVKFLVAMLALGVLAAHLCFASWQRRILFMAAAIIAPILANGVRAWGTIYLAQIYGVDFAIGWDHVVYGWFFFALIMALLFAAAMPFFDRPANARFVDWQALSDSTALDRLERCPARAMPVFLAVLFMAGGALVWATAAARLEASMPARIALPEVRGWHLTDSRSEILWQPRPSGPRHRLQARLSDGKGHEADVFFALYSTQRDGAEAGGPGQGALGSDGTWSWISAGPDFAPGKSEYILAQGNVKRLAVTYHRTGDLLTGSNLSLKLAVMRDKLLLRAQPVAVLIISAEDGSRASAADSVSALLDKIGPVGAWMDRASERP